MITIGIIGTAGRKDDYNRLNKEKYYGMMAATQEIIKDITSYREDKDVHVVSGGAAFADHLAVLSFLGGFAKGLTLHLPASFDISKNKYESTKDGDIANYYHKRFSSMIFGTPDDSLLQIKQAITQGAKVVVWDGFKRRNLEVARDSTYLIALTFGNGAMIKDGGTAHTATTYCIFSSKPPMGLMHIDLNTMESYCPALLPR